jgi:hypothetical protein
MKRRLHPMMWGIFVAIVGAPLVGLITSAQANRTPPQLGRLNARTTLAREQSRDRFLAKHPRQVIADDRELTSHPQSDKRWSDVRLVRLSSGALRAEIHDRQKVGTSAEAPSGAVVTIVNSKSLTYRTFSLRGTTPDVDEVQKIRVHMAHESAQAGIVSRGDRMAAQVSPIPAPFPSTRQLPAGRASALRRKAPTSHSLLARTLSGALRTFYPHASAQDIGCYGYWYYVQQMYDPTFGFGINPIAEDYGELDWGYDWDWWDNGTAGVWAANPVPIVNDHWFVDYADLLYDSFPEWGTGYMQTDAGYHNDDFILNFGSRVNAWMGGYIYYDSGWVDTMQYFSAWGAWDSLLLAAQTIPPFRGFGQDFCYYGF